MFFEAAQPKAVVTFSQCSNKYYAMQVTETSLPGVLLVKPKVFKDPRGFFLETWHAERYEKFGIPHQFVQDNVSYSERGVLRGLHFQNPYPQGKLLSVLMGEVYDVAVDIRVGSPHFGKWFGTSLSSENNHQLWIPAGFAHGFCVTSPTAMVSYKCTEFYHPESEVSILWNDPEINIQWPELEVQLSVKDSRGFSFANIPKHLLPLYTENA